MTIGYRVDSETGEAVEITEAERVHVCMAWAACHTALQEAFGEAERLRDELRGLAKAVERAVPIGSACNLGAGRTLVVEPGTSGRRAVMADVAEAHSEVLADLGLGEYERKYRPPTLAQVTSARAEIIAAGVPLSELVREASLGDPKITIVTARGAS